MRTRIRKWGNSLAVRIPKPFAAEAGLREDAQVDLALVEGELVIRPPREEGLRLEDLLRRVTRRNLHGEWETGPPVGREAW